MSKIRTLMNNYENYIAIPWKSDAAAGQRVIFCVYNEDDELRLRYNIGEFEMSTKKAGHEWLLFDITDSFAKWLSSQKYAKSYFENPKHLTPLLGRYLDYIDDEFQNFLKIKQSDEKTVVALIGIGSVFGLIKVKDLVDKIAPSFTGRLVVFFPGSFENNNYRLLDGYDGWNYLAVPITSDKEL